MKQNLVSALRPVPRVLLPLLAVAGLGLASAADTDIATAPLFTSSNTQVKPNIMFILDDSGSMARDYLPDAANYGSSKYGKKSAHCNGLAYNPSITYSPPTNADGTLKSAASLSVITNVSNPTTQTTSIRTVSGTVTMPATMTGTISITVTGSNFTNTTYAVDEIVTLFQNNDSGRFFTGEVVSWTKTNNSTGTLVISLDGGNKEGTGSFSSPRIGKGQPSSPVYYTYKSPGTQRPLSYTYDTNGPIYNTTFIAECNSDVGSTPGSNVFNTVSVTAVSAEAQNYANWVTYYSNRMKLMQAGVSKAFAGIDARYRVGYSTINERAAVAGDNFVDIADFDTTQKATFYSRMFDATPGPSTPLRGALSKAGQYFAKKAQGQTVDPVQYSCQRNYSILSTDGYWNNNDETSSTPKFGPYKLDNSTAVGQQDGAGTLRPMHDGEVGTVTTTETWTRTTVKEQEVDTPTTTRTVPAGNGATLTLYNESGTTDYSIISVLLPKTFTRNSDMTRSGSTITVANYTHNLLSGDVIVVTGNGNANFNTPVGGSTVTRISSTSFSYTGSGSSGNSSGTSTFAPQAAASCSAGQGVRRQIVEGRNLSYTLSKSVSVGGTINIARQQQTQTTTTPMTRTIVVTDGVQTSDTTTSGSPSTNTVTNSTTNVNGGTAAAATTTVTSDPVMVGSTSAIIPALTITDSTCSNSASGPNTNGSLGSNNDDDAISNVKHPSFSGSSTGNASTSVQSTTTTDGTKTTNTPTTVYSGGTSNTLADVAMYYYNTDLRTSDLSNCTGALNSDVCNNNVPGTTGSAQASYGDTATWQHMTTFTLGLGVGGILTYDKNYLTQTSGDFIDILNRSKNWPAAGPTKGAENTDDLWHAAVNGRGQYFSAGDPNTLATALTGALDAIKAITGTAAAASTSSLNPVQGDNDVFVAQFTSAKWTGDLISRRIDPITGTIPSTSVWSARLQLDNKIVSTRKIYYQKSGALREFTYANLTTDGFNGNFDNFCTKAGVGGGNPTQCASLSVADKALANSGANLVNYLRGTQTLSYYRQRDSRLGDIITASPLFVGKPQFKYTENNYTQYAIDKVGRTAVVLTAANDGMLHAFRRSDGEELWAFMPSAVLPNLYKLADNNYTNFHSFFVDGSPQMGDVYVPSGPKQGWRTIVIGGLGAGGKSYYALDVTDTENPEFLWEFSHDHLGLTFGNPIITKLADANGTWIVAFTSGYNNNTGNGDGNGRLFILNAYAGTLRTSLPTMLPDNTAAGDTTTPSGLSKLAAYVDTVTDNTAKRFYAGDLMGNLWRFDVNNLVQPHGAAMQLAKLTAPDGTPQSITTLPVMAEISYNGSSFPTVFVATGRYLGSSDAGSTVRQSLYGMKDPLTATGWGTARTNAAFVAQTLTASTNSSGQATRVLDSNPVDWVNKAGWRLDFPGTGERVTVNPQLAVNTLTVASIMPSDTVCTVGGESFLYRFNITSVGTDNAVVGTYVGNVLVQGLTNVQLADGTVVTITTTSKGDTEGNPQPPTLDPAALRRASWRELVD